ncbi:MAG: hypothetical protein GXY77_14545 [Fibrobacter sp.]|nr:hypothetical protein [Fibrobacter sp.]
MENYDFSEETIVKLKKEIQLLEDEIEIQAYISGLWIRYFKTMKAFVESKYSDTPLAEIVSLAAKESDSWEDVSQWLNEAKEAEKQFFERIEPDIPDSTDLEHLRIEVNFLKGVIRALLSTRETKLESFIGEYKNWGKEIDNEIENLLNQNNLVCTDKKKPL